jgi:hypothetical protein
MINDLLLVLVFTPQIMPKCMLGRTMAIAIIVGYLNQACYITSFVSQEVLFSLLSIL